MTISEPSDELVLKVREAIIDASDNIGRFEAEHCARAAIAAMPELTELQQRVKQLEEALRKIADLEEPREWDGLHLPGMDDTCHHGRSINNEICHSCIRDYARSLLSDKGED